MQPLNLVVDDLNRFNRDTLVAPSFNHRLVRSVTDKLALLEKLICTQELQPLLSIFSLELTKMLPISGLIYHNGKQQIHLKYSGHSQHSLESVLAHDNTPLGTFTYQSVQPLSERQRQFIADMEQQLLQPLCNVLQFETNKKMALKDYLTDLGNRSYFEETYQRMLATANRENRPFSLVVIDLDHFKRVNDTLGHATGDQVLVTFANLLKNSLRTNDYSFRFGGDEFVLLLGNDKQQRPELVAERIQKAVKNSQQLKDYGISCSLGFTGWEPQDTAETLFERADKALYKAKANGRNCFCGG